MHALFLKVLEISLTGSLFAIAVILVRILFRKAPRWIFCVLWGLVALRLILPVSIESDFSIVPKSVASGQVISNIGESYVLYGDGCANLCLRSEIRCAAIQQF